MILFSGGSRFFFVLAVAVNVINVYFGGSKDNVDSSSNSSSSVSDEVSNVDDLSSIDLAGTSEGGSAATGEALSLGFLHQYYNYNKHACDNKYYRADYFKNSHFSVFLQNKYLVRGRDMVGVDVSETDSDGNGIPDDLE